MKGNIARLVFLFIILLLRQTDMSFARHLFPAFLFLSLSPVTHGQSYFYEGLSFGDHTVGFRIDSFTDYGRQGFDADPQAGRSISMGIWYPARSRSGRQMDYVTLLRQFRAMPGEPAEHPKQVFYRLLNDYHIDTSKFEAHQEAMLRTTTRSYWKAQPAPGVFPVVIYPDNIPLQHVLCEYLASSGFIVVSPGLAGTYQGTYKYDVKDLETAVQDIQAVVQYLHIKYGYGPQFSLMATGFNATVCLNTFMCNRNAIRYISMEGGITTGFEEALIQKATYFDLERCDRPMLIMHAPHPDVKPELTWKYKYADRIYQSYPQTSEFYFLNFGLWESLVPGIFPNANRGNTVKSFQYAAQSVLSFLQGEYIAGFLTDQFTDSLLHTYHRPAVPKPPTGEELIGLFQEGGIGKLKKFYSERRVKDEQPFPSGVLWQTGAWMITNRHFEEGLEVSHIFLESFPESALAHILQGRCLLELNQRPESRESYQRALELLDGDANMGAAELTAFRHAILERLRELGAQ